MSKSNLELRSIYLKAEYISAEFHLTKENFDECKKNFFKAVSEKEDGKKALLAKEEPSIEEAIRDIVEEGADYSDTQEDIVAKKEFKTLYRRIMTIIHPDKISQLNDERIKKEYSELSASANKAYKEGDWYSLLNICYKLNFKEIKVNNEVICWLNDFYQNREADIDKMKKSFPWIWSASDEKVKQILVNKFIENLLKK